MTASPRYKTGQRWELASPVPEFEGTLVIGAFHKAHPEWGVKEDKYEVYVRYSDAAKSSIPEDYDGTVLSLTTEGLDRSVATLVEEGVKLRWWWIYGRRFKRKSEASDGLSVLSCDRVSDVLPAVFRRARQTAEDSRAVEVALREHRLKFPAGSAPRPPSQSVAESWKRIEAWHGEHGESIEGSLAPGASDAEIESFEAAVGARLPEDFRESVRIHNGGGWWVPATNGDLMSLEDILRQWTMYGEWQAEGSYANGSDDWIPRELKGPVKPDFWNRRRIHVTDNSGDHLTLDLDPPADGVYGQVLHHSHEVGPTGVEASSWGEFLQKLVADLESGRYVWLQGMLEQVDELERRRK